MISSALNSFAAPWSHVAKLYRQICLLRANGRADEAETIQAGEFAAARAAAERETILEDPSRLPSLIQALLDAEEDRVADALLLAEALAPRIVDLIRPALTAPFPQPSALSTPALHAPSPRSEHSRIPPAIAPSIADLIDGMLGQQPPARDHRAQQIPA